MRDHGGDGPPIVLMHGAGTHLLSMELLANALIGHRVVTMDQRWSGQSGDGDVYRWSDLVDDVECVADALGLANPIVGGHSWGGMIAVHYGVRHPEAPAVFNLDGHGRGDASLYDGVDPSELAALDRSMAAPPRHLGAEGDDEWKAARLVKVRRTYAALGTPEDDLDAFAERSFVRLDDHRWRQHPSPAMYLGLTGDQRLFELYRQIACPLLVVSSSGRDWGPPSAATLMASYQRGLARAFAELTAVRTNVQVVHLLEADHVSLVRRGAATVARIVRDFLARAIERPGS